MNEERRVRGVNEERRVTGVNEESYGVERREESSLGSNGCERIEELGTY